MNQPKLRETVTRARERLASGREKLRAQHATGSPGVQVCALLTELLDDVVLDLYRSAVAEAPAVSAAAAANDIALVALGGYGRRDVAPFSDVDLMVLHAPGAETHVAPIARRLMLDLYDTNLQVGNCVRTPPEAISLAQKDGTVFTSLVEARLLAGGEALFEQFASRLHRAALRNPYALLANVEASRREESDQFGETVFLLEPNLKKSPGGLRDIQFIRWIGFARYGEREPEALALAGALPKGDEERLRAAREFFLRLRNELHFQRGKAYDVLDRGEQVRLAAWLELPGDKAILPVERFMRDYFEHSGEVRTILRNFVEGARRPATVVGMLGELFSHQVEGDFRVGPFDIAATRRGLKKLQGNVGEVLRLADLANYYGKPIAYGTWRAIRNSMNGHAEFVPSRDATERFLSLMGQTGRLGESLRKLHELRVLERLVPGLPHARYQMQFNDYHKFTVDEHSLRAVECATEFAQRGDTLGQVYRGVKNKRLLHLALLMHDLGKGFEEDHSEVGRRLADEAAKQWRLPLLEGEALKFLVHKHLIMAHLAMWRDTSDDDVVVKFAVEVGSPELLQQLYVLTCADLAAVGPGVLNDWKLELITRLYERAMLQLAGDTATIDERLEQRREAVRKLAPARDADWWKQQVAALPAGYLYGSSPAKIVEELDRVKQLPRHEAVAWGRMLPQGSAVEYTVGTHEEIVPGIFHRLTGALTSQGLSILSAEIHTLPDNLVFDRFCVQDHDFSGAPPAERLESVSRALVAALRDGAGLPPKFRKLFKAAGSGPVQPLPANVKIDNNTSERYTIIDVFAHDRMGLLYAITRTLFELGLSVGLAKIGTHLDQVVDVFYVTDQSGRKLPPERFDEIRARVLAAIGELEKGNASNGSA